SANLAGARLDGAVFHAADLSGADLRAASYLGADFEEAWLIGVCSEASLSPPAGSLEEDARRAGFPTFAQALYSVYLKLLRAPGPRALWIVETMVAVSPAPEAEVLALLRFRNWRMNVLGATAMLAGAASPETLQAAWEVLDRGSWVAPQLAAVLLL